VRSPSRRGVLEMVKVGQTGSLIAVSVSKTSATPFHRQIADQIRDAILQGHIPPGMKLPSTRTLADELAVSRNTILMAFEILAEEGAVASRTGDGTYVTGALWEDGIPSLPEAPRRGDGAAPPRILSARGRTLTVAAAGEFAEHTTPFMPDLPDLRQFPIRTWLRLLNEVSGRLTGEILATTPNAGYEPLRRAIAQHLGSSRGMRCDPGQVIITTGTHQSLDLVCRLLVDPDDPVWFEEPGYVGARAVIAANGGSVHPVEVDARGLRVEDAARTLPVPRLIFTSAARHYPLGATLSMGRRQALLAFAERTGSWIVEDDYDYEFRYAGTSPPALFGLDLAARTLHMGTFSKILLPSLRLGYLVVPLDLADAFAKARATVDRHASLVEQLVLSEFMSRGLLVSHIRRMRTLYGQRQAALLNGMRATFGADLPVTATETGMHVVLPLKDTVKDHSIVRSLAERGVVARALSPYFAGPSKRNGLLLGFAAFDSDEIALGLRRIEPLASDLAGSIDRTPAE